MQINHRIDNEIAVVFFEEQLTMNDVREFKAHMKILIDNPSVKAIVLNMVDVEYIDSSGFGAILAVFKQLKKLEKKFSVCQLGARLHEDFIRLRMDKMLPLFSKEQEALDHLLSK